MRGPTRLAEIEEILKRPDRQQAFGKYAYDMYQQAVLEKEKKLAAKKAKAEQQKQAGLEIKENQPIIV